MNEETRGRSKARVDAMLTIVFPPRLCYFGMVDVRMVLLTLSAIVWMVVMGGEDVGFVPCIVKKSSISCLRCECKCHG